MKRMAGLLSLWMAAAGAQAETNLMWGNSSAITYFDLSTALPCATDDTNWMAGCFVQLISCGGNGVADAFHFAAATGVSGDDAVVATGFLGQNEGFGGQPGLYPFQPFLGVSMGTYFVRVFDDPSSDFPSGVNARFPDHSTNHFWQSSIGTYEPDITGYDDWDFAPSGGAALIPIPEPSTVVFGLLAIGGIAMVRRLRYTLYGREAKRADDPAE